MAAEPERPLMPPLLPLLEGSDLAMLEPLLDDSLTGITIPGIVLPAMVFPASCLKETDLPPTVFPPAVGRWPWVSGSVSESMVKSMTSP